MHPDQVAVSPRMADKQDRVAAVDSVPSLDQRAKKGRPLDGASYTHVFSSLRAPVVEALTCAKTSGLLILSARRCKLAFDHAGVMDRKTQGPELSASPSSRSVGYHPTPKPSALIELREGGRRR